MCYTRRMDKKAKTQPNQKAKLPFASPAAPAAGSGQVRLQKYLADCGLASRRGAEQMIAAGRVTLNGRVVTEMGVKLTPGQDQVSVDRVPLRPSGRLRYILLHKPAGYICSAHDEKGRRTVLDLLEGIEERVYPVGRLDYDTAGLLLLTNDGELTNLLLHPSHQVEKTYLAEVAGCPDRAALERLSRGVRLEDGLTAPGTARLIKRKEASSLVEISIHEGRNRQVRRMLDAVGCPVIHLKRIRLAFLDVKDLPLGRWRELNGDEVKRLRQVAGAK